MQRIANACAWWLRRLIFSAAFECLLVMLITFSVGLALGQRVGIAEATTPTLTAVGYGLTLFFVFELLLRYSLAGPTHRGAFIARYWIDLASLIPTFRAFRLVRIFRLLKTRELWRRHRKREPAFVGRVFTVGNPVAVAVSTMLTVFLASGTLVWLAEGATNEQLDEPLEVAWFLVFSTIAAEPVVDVVTDEGRMATLAPIVSALVVAGILQGARSARTEGVLDLDELNGHVLVFGWNAAAMIILKRLFGPDAPPDRAVVLVTEMPIPEDDIPRDLPYELLYRHIGDYTKRPVLDAVRAEHADVGLILSDELVVRSNADTDARVVLTALMLERTNPAIFTLAQLFSAENAEMLYSAGVEEVVMPSDYAGSLIGGAFGARGVTSVLRDLLSSDPSAGFVTCELHDSWNGRTLRELRHWLLDRWGASVIAVEVEGRPNIALQADWLLQAHQRVSVIGPPGIPRVLSAKSGRKRT